VEFDANSPETDLSKWADAGCNLASALALQGDWNSEGEALAQAMELSRQILARLNPEEAGLNYVWGALMNNLGHAQYRQGELLRQIDGVRKGLDTLKAGAEHHIKHGNKSAAEETNHIIVRAQEALAKLLGADISVVEPARNNGAS